MKHVKVDRNVMMTLIVIFDKKNHLLPFDINTYFFLSRVIKSMGSFIWITELFERICAKEETADIVVK